MELELGPLRFGIIGAGRLGCTIGRALQQQGLEVVQASSASAPGRERAAHFLQVPVHESVVEVASQVDCVVVCVPDDALASVVHALTLRPGDASPMRLRVVSTSAGGGIAALAPLDAAGHSTAVVHPMATVNEHGTDGRALAGAGAAIGASDEAARVFAHGLAHALALHPFDLDDAAWPLHAAACTIAANLVPVVLGAAESLAVEAGIHEGIARSGYGRLAAASVDRWIHDGADGAIGGPILRGDVAAITAQLDAVHRSTPANEALVREALRVAVVRASMSGRLDVPTSHALEVGITGRPA